MAELSGRVVITGIGVVSPFGLELDQLWSKLSAGVSGIAKLDSLPENVLPFRYGGEAKEFRGEIEDYGPLDKQLQRAIKKNIKVMCREIEMGVAASQRALAHSGLTSDLRDPQKTGIVFGSDYIMSRPEEYVDGVRACHDEQKAFHVEWWPTHGLTKVNPLWLLKYLPNMPASHVAIYNDLRGPSNSLTVRDASTGLSFAEATAVIRRGVADAMVVGSTGSHIQPARSIHVAGQHPVASERDDPAQMARPFDRSRDGMVHGEGAAAFVLESLESAVRRGATIIGEVIAAISTCSGAASTHGIADSLRRLLGRLLAKESNFIDAGCHIHASGRGDLEGDAAEARAIQDALGKAGSSVPVVAAKSFFGHLGAGSAAVEIAASCLALQKGELFPTLNCHELDPGCKISVKDEKQLAGSGFVHLAYSPQGQCSGVMIRQLVSA